jgi:hypothetical protein
VTYYGERGPVPKAKKRVVDKKHVSFLHDLPCCLSGSRSHIITHHLLRCPSRLGRRAGDNHTLPMTDELHKELHDKVGDERKFLAKFGIHSPVELAESLYENTADHSACLEILGALKNESDS